jgi:hypothetical protein
LVNAPVPEMTPAKLVELAVPAVSVLAPSLIVLPATPLRSWIVWLPPAEMSNPAPAPARASPLLDAIEPPDPSARVPA